MWKEVDRPTLDGNLNTNVFITDRNGRLALQRFPRENPDLMANLYWEYRDIGFTKTGGRFRRRTPYEQYTFGYHAAQSGLKVLPPLDYKGNTVIFPYLEQARQINEYFASKPQEVSTIVGELFLDLEQAHTKGFVYGDRWAGNILIDPTYNLVHIDFDIEISGRFAQELDIAQVAYHTLWSGISNGISMSPIVARAFALLSDTYDALTVFRYMRGLACFLDKTAVGSMENEVQSCIELINLH